MRGKLEKDGAAPEKLLGVLEALKERTVSVKVMLDTKIGFSVKALRKNSDSGVAKIAGEVTAKWKAQVQSHNGGKGTPSKQDGDEKSEAKSPQEKAEKKVEVKKEEEPKKSSKGAPAKLKEVASVKRPPAPSTGNNEKRTRVRELLSKALVLEAAQDKADQLAGEIEEELWKFFVGRDDQVGPRGFQADLALKSEKIDQYTAKVKSIKFNLQDPKNLDFRKQVCSGEIGADCIPQLTANQMAGKAKIEEKKANYDEAVFQNQMHITANQTLMPSSDMFKCGKCKKSECTFYQKQTRSADEPMTVFITCKNCGHEWRDGG